MEINRWSDTMAPSDGSGCANELNRCSSDTSSLTAENSLDKAKPDAYTVWTDKKHSLYLKHLEVSFVNQLHKSLGLLAPCSEPGQREQNITELQQINVHHAPEQVESLNNQYEGDELLRHTSAESRHTSAESHNFLKSPWAYCLKRNRTHCTPQLAHVPELVKLRSTKDYGKGPVRHGLETCSDQFSCSSSYRGLLCESTKEGTGQNFFDEEDQSKSNFGCRAKRFKTALADSSSDDQIVPSKKSPTTDD